VLRWLLRPLRQFLLEELQELDEILEGTQR
jgi:hypothetical protein